MAPPLLVLAAAVLSSLSVASAENATIGWIDEVPEWQQNAAMELQLTPPGANVPPIIFSVFPLTRNVGLNESSMSRRALSLHGNLVHTEPASSGRVRSAEHIPYLSCDADNATVTINNIMIGFPKPKAIILYSEKGNCCRLQGVDLTYNTIFTMGSSAEAQQTLNFTSTADGIVQASIIGNLTSPEAEETQNGSNSAVAMSILYSITGLITLLFLVIIATGAIRAHRYPERYGPRSGYGGRPRQSRAKGLARAVLETLPIVKFGDPNQGKLDPALELEQQPSRSSPDPAMRTRLSAIPEEPRTPNTKPRDTISRLDPATIPEGTPTTDPEPTTTGMHRNSQIGTSHGPDDEHLGCSICTEDFTVGEDVRVLPCDHKFHPPCIDPWLINVSGTCPLCRLDLRPHDEKGELETTSEDLEHLPPPLAGEWNESEENAGPSRERRRASRILDLHRLRSATVEERIEILRRHRSQQQQRSTTDGGDAEERGRRAKLADRLREKFRVRTRTQPANPSNSRNSTIGPPGAVPS